MRVAIVHEWFTVPAGSEKVVQQLLTLYPNADLFALVDFLPETERNIIFNKPVTTSFIQHLPLARTKYRAYLPLMPFAVEQFDLSGYDLVISSSHAVAKGVLVGPDQLHISYVHSPIRYAWDLQHQYLQESNLARGAKSWLARYILHKMRMWDVRTANGVDAFVANSGFIARRILKTYRRDATVIYPPVDVSAFGLHRDKEDFYLAASRMVPYKKLHLIVSAFAAMPDKRLLVIGSGPDLAKVKALAGANVTLLGYQPYEVLKDCMQRAKAFIFAAEEDFGIMPVEAQACGTPVIAYGRGGVRETVCDMEHERPTGLFFGEQTEAAIIEAVQQFEAQQHMFTPEACAENAQRFTQERFRAEFRALVKREWARLQIVRQHANADC